MRRAQNSYPVTPCLIPIQTTSSERKHMHYIQESSNGSLSGPVEDTSNSNFSMQYPHIQPQYQMISPRSSPEGYIYHPAWPSPTMFPFPANTAYASYLPTADFPFQRLDTAQTIRRAYQRPQSRRPLPWPTTTTRAPTLRPNAASHPQLTIKPIHLKRKPRDWRGSYKSSSKGGLAKYFRRIALGIPRTKSIRTPLRIHRSILYQIPRSATLSYDLRVHPVTAYDVELRAQEPPLTPKELYQLASAPPAAYLQLWHEKLPWTLTVQASTPHGVTVEDLLVGVYEQLQTPIRHHEYYTVALNVEDRQMVDMAFQRRCKGDAREIRKGVRRVDFLGDEICFVGVHRSKGGTWELKTVAPVRRRMLLE